MNDAAAADEVPEPLEAPSAPEVVRTRFVPDEDGNVTVELAQDVEPILDYAKERAASGAGRSPSNEMHELAHFPSVLVERYCRERGVSFYEFMANPEHVQAMLADPALAYFRVLGNNPHGLMR